MTIQEAQDKIIEEFSLLDGDMEMSNVYLMELGQKLPDFPEDKRDEEHIVKGCQSKVWLNAKLEDGKVVYEADSNTAITKGLVSLLIRVFSEQKPEDILNADLYFAEKIGMNRFIGTQRSNGFGAMIKQMKLDAMVLQKVSN
ncbi:SufE family protein [Mangrovivirga cuniculi]|uniref:Fe-S metabolism protein SufE n=1 Tax=Mangrovivirga cuniculi TaxID=2715131 RepID=A0A4D7JJ78_9BACT|nr:SufE family protein [Mangrovivirga cuniculi]QCK15043.1 Fe-S metabolism protein SufE [Mangrovivirga cuniculi]